MRLVNKKSVGKRRVYDIEVENVHNFFANGINVHNCATDGGVSVINHNGTLANVNDVVDLTFTSTNNISDVCYFDGLGGMAWGSRAISGASTFLFREFTIPSADKSTVPDRVYQPTSIDVGIPVYKGDGGPFILSSIDTNDGWSIGSSQAVTLAAEDVSVTENSMVAYITTSYNTGWMQGDIELALSDSLTDRSTTVTTVTDSGTAVIEDIATGADQKKITASGGNITAPVTTGGAIYGWEEIAGIMIFRPGTGWVGISETAGTLTIVDGTTFAMLKYTNGSGPFSAQYTKIELDELWITRANSKAFIDGSSDAVEALSFDPQTNKLDVATGDGTSTFINLQRIDYIDNTGTQTSDTMIAVSRKDDQLALATSAETVFQKSQEDL